MESYVPNDRIFHCLNISQNSPNLVYTSHLLKNFITYCRSQFPSLGGAIIKESVFCIITHTYFVPHSKTLYPRVHWIVVNSPVPISTYRFFCKFAKCCKLSFSNSSQFPRNFAHSICGLSWQKVIERILMVQSILKLLNDNFWQISFQTGSVAYFHIGVSEWHETQVTIP